VNLQGSGCGNDAAIDNIRVLDVTPRLDQAFGPSPVEINTPATLTYTITNTAELAVKTGWSFSGTLPNGLTATATPTTDCVDATATAGPGATGQHAGLNLPGCTSITFTPPALRFDAHAHAHGGKVSGPLLAVPPGPLRPDLRRDAGRRQRHPCHRQPRRSRLAGGHHHPCKR
jgi:hypothetical protein